MLVNLNEAAPEYNPPGIIMENMLHTSVFTTVLILAALLLVLLILYHTIKGILKIAAMIAALLLVYAGYLFLSGQKIPFTKEEIMKHGSSQFEIIKEKLPEAVKKHNGN